MTDTGPPYPPLPGSGSNALGVGAVGTTLSIGDIVPFDWRQTILSQYANSPIITGLIERFADALDQTQNISNFFDLMFNLDTAVGYGLDVWGRIVGVNRTLQLPNAVWFGFAESLPGCLSFGDAGPMHYAPSFGFAEAADPNGAVDYDTAQPLGLGGFGLFKAFRNDPLGAGPLYPGGSLTSNFQLTDESYRLLIIAKAMANITDGSIPSINGILLALFPDRGNCYVTDGPPVPSYFGFAEARNTFGFNDAGPVSYGASFGFVEATPDPNGPFSMTAETFGQAPFGLAKIFANTNRFNAPFYAGQAIPRMSIQYVFDFALTAVELAVVEQSGVLPKPSGVKASVVVNGRAGDFVTPNNS